MYLNIRSRLTCEYQVQVERVHRHALALYAFNTRTASTRVSAHSSSSADRNTYVGGVITNEPEPRARSSTGGVIFTVQEWNKEDMGRLSMETRAKVILRKTKGIHVLFSIQSRQVTFPPGLLLVHSRDLPLDRELVANQASTNIKYIL